MKGETVRYSWSSFEVGALTPLESSFLTTGTIKKHTIFGPEIPISARRTIRNVSTTLSIGPGHPPVSTNRLSTLNAAGHPSSVISSGSLLRPPSTASGVSVFTTRLARHPAPLLLDLPLSVGTKRISGVPERDNPRNGKPNRRVLILHSCLMVVLQKTVDEALTVGEYPLLIFSLRTTNVQLRCCRLPLEGLHLLVLLSTSRKLVAMVILTMVTTLPLRHLARRSGLALSPNRSLARQDPRAFTKRVMVRILILPFFNNTIWNILSNS